MKNTIIFLQSLVILTLLLAENVPLNGLLALTGSGYEVPAQSSYQDFHPVIMNSGSGEWWVLGADSKNIYLVPEEGGTPYKVIEQQDFMRKINGLF